MQIKKVDLTKARLTLTLTKTFDEWEAIRRALQYEKDDTPAGAFESEVDKMLDRIIEANAYEVEPEPED